MLRTMERGSRSRFCLTTVALVLVGVLPACGGEGFDAKGKGIQLAANSVHLYGSETVAARPATIEWDVLTKETPEHRTIRAEGIRPGTARHELLVSKMLDRIRLACRTMAETEGYDCVVRAEDVADAGEVETTDRTQAVKKLLTRVEPR